MKSSADKFLPIQAFCDDLVAKASVHVAAVQAKMAAITGRAHQKKDQ
jgi:hypothetical protein